MKWTIINSIELAKLYNSEKKILQISSTFQNRNDITKFLDTNDIKYSVVERKSKLSNGIFFGARVNFQRLYILCGILKSYGNYKVYYDYRLSDRIHFGNFKRLFKNFKNYEIELDTILAMPFLTSIQDLIDKFDFHETEKVNLTKFFPISDDELQIIEEERERKLEEDMHKTLDEIIEFEKKIAEIEKIESRITNDTDNFEDFRWGGLSGEEAYDAMWNCD